MRYSGGGVQHTASHHRYLSRVTIIDICGV